MGTDEDSTTLARPSAVLPKSARFSVEIVAGPDRGARLEIDPKEPARLLVGQSAACAFRLSDAAVSRRHVAVSVEGAELHLVDLRSTNGTWVNGVRVSDAWLRGGETIQLGASELVVRRLGDEPAVGLTGDDGFGPLIGRSPQMRRLYPLLARLAASKVPVIIEGETGTGKEVLAEALHEQGPRATNPFLVFDCTSVASTLLEATLFGHERGSFTGATAERRGVFEEAHGGTLLIDEIGDLDLPLQAKLLRAVQRSEVQRLGSTRWLRVDVRILAATRRDLDREVQAGRFREDLFYRLNVARIELPPLRERSGDVALLARYFWDRLGGRELPVPVDVFQAWEDAIWPGNVRELENAVARRLALGDLAPPVDSGPARAPLEHLHLPFDGRVPLAVARQSLIETFERQYLERLLAAHGGHVANAAAAAGVGRRYFNMLRARYRL
jgi:transcriptional regulator with GAF, ATPase, and Fis domain